MPVRVRGPEPEARVAHVRFAGPAREARRARRRNPRRGDDSGGCGSCGGGCGGVVGTAPGGRVGVGVGGGGGDSEGLRRPVCGHMERVLRLLLLLCLGSLRLLLVLLLRRIRVHRPARARARRRRRVHTTRRYRHHGRVRVRVRVRVCRSKRKRRTGTLESDALHRETSVSGLLRTESIDISRVRRAAARPRGGGAGVDRRGRRAGGVERAGAECLICWVGVRVVCIVVLSWRARWRWVVPLLLLRAVRAASVARRRLHFFFLAWGSFSFSFSCFTWVLVLF